uniref:Putative septum site-determining protein MinD n=2 Tax=Pavlovaceae TaxID=418969 RepID=M1K062_DIALT|nr:septum site-determining protein [Diacronema lutheri]YP_009863835.1 septum site-determining protein minD [Pavlova sp. NIVA-4/92]AGE93812.1 septum site-determining protein [Diacronema lutheri]QKE31166.1 septum site-determining protein minD [Pavlova sp. NIVA-4/92]|mmetsp:Transcript_10702/g.33746  ORF Transcript_10702/g.33746 Transcript_10702/m.33746 type:complete len:265 (-) Transcript_10702:1871-2665(-)
MSRTIVVTSGKGGVGKTTVTANLGVCLSELGSKVLLIDADTGLRNLDLMLGLENRIVFNCFDFLDGKCTIEQTLVRDKQTEGDLLLLSLTKNREERSLSEDEMIGIISKLREKFDFILIDSPAGIDEGFRISIAAAEEALVVITPELASIRDADKVIGLLLSKQIEKVNLVINRVRPEMVQRNNMISVDDIVDILSTNIIGVIPEDKNIIISTNRGEPIVKDKNKSLISQSLKDTARRITGQKIPFLDLESHWIKRLFFKRQRS